jgi:hypothetical protein
MQMLLLGNEEEFIRMNALHSVRKVWALVVIPLNMVGSVALRQGSLGLGAGVAAGSGSRDWVWVADLVMPLTCIVVSCLTWTRRSATLTRMAVLSVNDSS